MALEFILDEVLSILNYDQLEDNFVSLMYKPSRFHVAVRLFSNRSQRTSKRGKNISDTLRYLLVCHVLFLPDF